MDKFAAGLFSNSWTWYPGNKAIPGQPFFLKIENQAGSSAFGSTFTVAATASSSTSPSHVTKTQSSSTSSTNASNQTGATTPPSTSTQSRGLSTGAKAGIGIGVALGVILVIALAVLFNLKRRKTARSRKAQELAGQEIYGRTPQEKSQNYILIYAGPPIEMQGSQPRRSEMEGNPRERPELAG
jgi:hypothetical protein